MNRNSKTVIYCIFTVSAVSALIGAVCLFFGLQTEFDAALGYFSKNAIYAPALYFVIVLGLICGAAGWIMFGKKCAADEKNAGNKLANKITGILCAVCIAADTAVDIFDTFSGEASQIPFIHYTVWLFGLLGAVGMVIAAQPDRANDPIRSLAGFFTPLFLAGKVLTLYFSKASAVNSPIKLLIQIALLSFMLSFTAETGISLGRVHLLPRWIFTLCLSVTVGGGVGGGLLLAMCAKTQIADVSIADPVMFTALAAYCAQKLFFTTKMKLMPRVPKKAKNK